MSSSFSLDPANILISWSGHNVGGRRRARDSRRNDTRSATLEIEHKPTGVRVKGEIPSGHYSRGELRKATDKLTLQLLEQLEPLVKSAIKGQRQSARAAASRAKQTSEPEG